MNSEAAEEPSGLEEQIIEALRQVYDPEIPVNIYDLGLVYKIETTLTEKGHDVRVAMTLTSANCPLADMIPGMVYDKLVQIPDLNEIDINLVFDPPWEPSKMTHDARIALGMEED